MDTTTATARGVRLRAGKPEDAQELGRICYEAFASIAGKHNFPPDFPSPEIAAGLMEMMLSLPDVYSVVAEAGGKTVGSNFLWESDDIAGVGPITVDPAAQNSSIGRAMMEYVVKRADDRDFLAVRLVQAAYHSRSLALYTKLGFDTVEPLSNIQGDPLNITLPGYEVRPMTEADVDAADRLCRSVHGHSRRNEITASVAMGNARIVEHLGRITGYTTGVGIMGHSLGESNRELMALIGAAPSFPGMGFLLPTRNNELLRWCLCNGLRIVQPLTLMSRGLYQPPSGAFLPSILF